MARDGAFFQKMAEDIQDYIKEQMPEWRDRWSFNQRALRTFVSAPVSPAATSL